MRWIAVLSLALLAACEVAPAPPGPAQPAQAQPRTPETPDASQLALFQRVVTRVEPEAERYCKTRIDNGNCDFNIVIDDRRGQPPNAFQTLDRNGRPVIGFTASLIADARNADELAFILSHEAAHHIAGHIPRQQQNATAGAILLGGLASLAGAGAGAVDAATNLGATVGARSYSKEFELEADAMGTVIAKRSGYDPVRGAAYFTRIPDPGDRFLGTHPPNAQRIETVRRVNSGL